MHNPPFFEKLPPEIREAILQQQEHMEMHREADLHALRDFFDELNEEQLRALSLLMLLVKDPERNAYYEAIIDSHLQFKFGTCPCGKNHNEDELLAGPARIGEDAVVTPDADANENERLMHEYNMYQDPEGSLHCNGCDMPYVSLEDRMRRDPGVEGCPGCQHKAKFG